MHLNQDGHPVGLIDLAARYALSRGFHVIIEGVLNATVYQDSLRRLARDHRGLTRCYLFDVSFEETLRRHASKPVAGAFGEAEMRSWWRGFQPSTGWMRRGQGATSWTPARPWPQVPG
jgi:hypothetical protein